MHTYMYAKHAHTHMHTHTHTHAHTHAHAQTESQNTDKLSANYMLATVSYLPNYLGALTMPTPSSRNINL